MDLQGQRDLQLLNEVERDAGITQRSLANKLGVALGLTNLYLKRLARKGYIKITTIPSHRIKYLLTPRGVAEKSRLTYAYLQYSLSYYREMRQQLNHVLTELSRAGAKRVAVYGTGELAELAYLTLREMDLTLVGFVNGGREQTFLSYPLWPVEALSGWNYDALLIADLADTKKIHARLVRAGVPKDKIITLDFSGNGGSNKSS
jgi:DNA-binding Lrp family transcriptional regulator